MVDREVAEAVIVQLACPACGNEEVGEADMILATARGAWVQLPDGSREFEPAGDTEVVWDTQEPHDKEKPCYCTNCSWEGPAEELEVPNHMEPGEAWALIEEALADHFDGETPDDIGTALQTLRRA
jgi:hypothetical protein